MRITGLHARRARRLDALAGSGPSLAEAVRRGARLEPGDVYRAFPYAIHPSWPRGHSFSVGQEVTGEGGGTWIVKVGNGSAISVVSGPEAEGIQPDAAVTLTRGAFDALLRREPPPPGERPRVRGDRGAVTLLKAWTDRAQGDPAPDPPGTP
ncbi:MAG: hypothetical protein AVDCRST_MAG30-1208 [uncultured Solirubrobacteraceae bacterium]|uniref:SCP2 domain-containing protein n=1 Tax=uncultured Solirubrobacteraceae bacterium TaxID=1162706 RepID=A0A6J4S3V9_9ACTN|nr:MAG: hypothetical protein AVDCRST_MAG30-1208 [uncultured Solirubrobacteraceae bacterium]